MDKTMEKEYKWRADEKLLGQALLWASSRIGSQSRTINMESSYFDTADGLLKEHQAALRLAPRERPQRVLHEAAQHGYAGRHACPRGVPVRGGLSAGRSAPFARAWCAERPVRAALAADLQEICTVSFRRCAVLLQEGDTVCEMALDEGELRHNGKSAPLCEIELEYVAGSEDTFHALAAELAQQLDLVVEPTSKLARAMAL